MYLSGALYSDVNECRGGFQLWTDEQIPHKSHNALSGMSRHGKGSILRFKKRERQYKREIRTGAIWERPLQEEWGRWYTIIADTEVVNEWVYNKVKRRKNKAEQQRECVKLDSLSDKYKNITINVRDKRCSCWPRLLTVREPDREVKWSATQVRNKSDGPIQDFQFHRPPEKLMEHHENLINSELSMKAHRAAAQAHEWTSSKCGLMRANSWDHLLKQFCQWQQIKHVFGHMSNESAPQREFSKKKRES